MKKLILRDCHQGCLGIYSREMKFVLSILAVSGIALTSCERHDFEETKKLHEQHESHGAGAGSHGSTKHEEPGHDAAEKAEH